MTLFEIFVNVRTLIAAGWTQGAVIKHTAAGKCFCAVGAINFASSYDAETGTTRSAQKALYNVLPPQENEYNENIPCNRIIRWNDAPGRTQQEVLQKIDEVIAALPH